MQISLISFLKKHLLQSAQLFYVKTEQLLHDIEKLFGFSKECLNSASKQAC